jgi:hypothetical protein
MNGKILDELKVKPVDDKPRKYKSNWLRHVETKTKKKKETNTFHL